MLADWLAQQPYTLAMSSGFFGFFAHLGCLDALHASGLAPSAISGSSAGALAGAFFAASANPGQIMQRLFDLRTAEFWDPSPGFGILQGKLFRNLIAEFCTVERIEDCRIPLSISAFDFRTLSTHVIRQGSISDAVYASCCVPLLFQPLRIGPSVYFDGGIGDRPALAGLPADNRILYHHLKSNWPTWKKDQGIPNILKDRPNTIAFMANHLASVGPFSLHRGKTAFDQSRAATLKALEQPIRERRIVV